MHDCLVRQQAHSRRLRIAHIGLYWAIVAGLLCAFAPTLFATPIVSAAVRVTPKFGTEVKDVATGATAVQLSGRAFDDLGLARGEAFAFADFGVLKISGSARGFQINSVSAATFSERLTITSSDIANGTPGAFDFSVALNGVLDAANGGSVVWNLTAGSAAPTLSKIGKHDTHFENGDFGDAFGVYEGTARFIYGLPVLLEVDLNAAAASPGTASSSGYDLGHSLYWNGISAITANGARLRNFTITSETGTDYLKSFVPVTVAVPEPLGAWVVVPGIIALSWMRRRKRDRVGLLGRESLTN